MPRSIRSLVLLALALAACDTPTESVTPVPGEASVQRQVWEQQGIDDYRFVFGRDCFCNPLPVVRVDVRDGRVVAVREVESGRAVSRDRWPEIRTVDQAFDMIAQAQAAGETLEVEYHPTLGYPMRLTIGTLANDAGVAYQLDRLIPAD